MSAPRHCISAHRQLMRDWLPGIVVTVLSAALVTLIGLLVTVDGGHTVTGPLIILVGLSIVVFVAAFWAADRVSQVPA